MRHLRRTMPFLLILCAVPLLRAQERIARGTVTFVSPDYVYTSLGRNAGLTDSMRVMVVRRGDTVAVLSVAALSSHSSACRIVSSTRPPAVGDSVRARVPLPARPERDSVTASLIDSLRETAAQPPSPAVRRAPADTGFLTLQGRASLQYRTLAFSQTEFNQSEPGVALQVRGIVNHSHVSFQIVGNFRTLIRNQDAIARFSSSNLTRVYRMSLDYDDGSTAISIGRVLPQYAPSIGTVDGGMVAHTFGAFTFGLSGGFEPTYITGISPTDLRKFSLFGGYRTPGQLVMQSTIAYSRTYYRSSLVRDVLAGGLTLFPDQSIFLNAQTEVDLRTPANGDLSGRAKMTSLFATLNIRPLRELSFGLGVSSWRPTYFAPTIFSTPSPFVDTRLRTTPMFSVTMYLPRGMSITNNYAPRTSDEQFAKEYSNNTSMNLIDALGTGVTCRGTYFVNAAQFSTVSGWSGSLQRSFATFLDCTVRYQRNRTELASFSQTLRTDALASDVLVNFAGRMSFWISAERDFGDQLSFTTFFTELSYRF